MQQSLGQQIKHLRGDERRGAIEEVLGAFRSSGKTRTAFCRDAGIAVVTLGRWEKELRGGGERSSDAEFVEVGRGGERGFEVELPGGVVLRVPQDFVESDLKRLLRMLGTAC